MSVGSDENTELLRERDRLPGKMALSLRQAQAATGSTVIWVPEEVDALHSTSSVMKSKVHWCRADWLSVKRRVSVLSGPVAMATLLAAVRRQPPEVENAGPGTRETETPVLARNRAPAVWSLRKIRWPQRTSLTPLSFKLQLMPQL